MLRNSSPVNIPANKFFPPKIPAGRTVSRTRLLRLLSSHHQPYQFFFLEAQAGQGKTTTAVQFLELLSGPCVWYQVGPEDIDPMVFLNCLCKGFAHSLPGFSSPVLHAQLEAGQAQLPDLPRLLGFFCRDLISYLEKAESENQRPTVLVLDDVHLLDSSAFSLGLLDSLLEAAPRSLVVMLLSRSPLPLRSKRVRFDGATLYLGNSELALTHDEGVELLDLLLDELPTPPVLNSLLQQAAGWPMGLVLASRNYAEGETVLQWRQEAVSGYLDRELLTTLDASQRSIALQLALLDEIPLPLAQQICPDEDMAGFLMTLVEHNFFLRFLDDEGTLFGFHHLFLSFLQHKARQVLDQEEQRRVYSLAAKYYLKQGMAGRAMHCYVKAQDFQALEQAMERFGQAMAAQGRLLTLHGLLKTIPEERVTQSAWFSYFFGITLQVSEPIPALEYFQRARTIFHDTGHNKGELLATADILYLYIIHSTVLPRSEAIHPDVAHALFAKAGAELPPFCRITTTHNIALGYLYFLNDFKKTRSYNELTRELAEKSMLPNMLIASQLASGWAFTMSGELAKGLAIVEQNYRLINKKELGLHGRLQLYFFQMDALRLLGDRQNFEVQRQEFIQSVGTETVSRTFIAPWLILWEVELAFNDGDFASVPRLLHDHLDTFQFQMPGHFRGELQAWHALFLAMQGRDLERIPALLDETRQWLNGGASPMHFIRAMLLMGNVCRLLGRPSEALGLLEKAETMALQSEMPQMLCRVYLNKALMYDLLHEHEKVRHSLQAGMELLMQTQGYGLLPAFYPQAMLRVVRMAYDAKIYQEFCEKYAWDVLKTALGPQKDIPALSIQILGAFTIALQGREPWDIAGALSQTQRKFLGLLLKQKTLTVGQLYIQTELWPDIPESMARQRFDTLMTRLRKVLAEIVHPYEIGDYLVVEKGVVSLEHCVVDAALFCMSAEEGLESLSQGRWWHAANRFSSAMRLWQGDLVVSLLDLSSDVARKPLGCLLAMAEAWSPVLRKLDRVEEALALCELVWRYDQTNIKLARQLYELIITSGSVGHARRIVDEFGQASLRIGLNPDEVSALVRNITAPAIA
jgi:LuxR family transcriptional regulator, maltose regulon positive regulatory protein